jgi:hypothetical protein
MNRTFSAEPDLPTLPQPIPCWTARPKWNTNQVADPAREEYLSQLGIECGILDLWRPFHVAVRPQHNGGTGTATRK